MDTPNRIRRIELDKQEYSFPFDNPSGARVNCTVTNGAGTVTLYEIKSQGDNKVKSQVGEPQFLSLDRGGSFYVSLNTAKKASTWEIVFRGKGTFQLELPEELLPRFKRGMKERLPSKEYDTEGRRKG